jgi:oligoribonuclease NrnB/cAMP/cGMP phosphodiesterase (DHH superfamily)
VKRENEHLKAGDIVLFDDGSEANSVYPWLLVTRIPDGKLILVDLTDYDSGQDGWLLEKQPPMKKIGRLPDIAAILKEKHGKT